jgi:hypothetical protein
MPDDELGTDRKKLKGTKGTIPTANTLENSRPSSV